MKIEYRGKIVTSNRIVIAGLVISLCLWELGRLVLSQLRKARRRDHPAL